MSGSIEIIRELREQIPRVPCQVGCTLCCGPVAFSHIEYEQIPREIRDKFHANVFPMGSGSRPAAQPMRAIIPTKKRLSGNKLLLSVMTPDSWMRLYAAGAAPKNWAHSCAFKGPMGCMVYPHRPIICRLYGIVLDRRLYCKTASVTVPLLSLERAVEITETWLSCMEQA